ncbi:hypothetical protein OBA18_00910 [Pelagibacteraceae bacterium]|nr:hypothetical protein [Pelagibacteraceae bacterium]
MNKILNEIFAAEPYQLESREKEKLLMQRISELDEVHQSKSKNYSKLISVNLFQSKKMSKFSDASFLPVQLFKSHKLMSIEPEKVIKTLTSSGTSGQLVSKIYLDKETSALQTKALVKIIKTYLGPKRIPMIILDTKSIFNGNNEFSARAAGILGMSNFGRDHFYALDENMDIDLKGLESWLKKYEGEAKFMFGFTFMVWQYLYQKCLTMGINLDFSNTVLFHSGGWKKLSEQAVSNKNFKDCLNKQFKLSKVHNFYGMVESVGSIYIECEEGFLHSPSFSEILIRRFTDWTESKIGEQGVVQVISSLAQSYPGHSILTEDLGTIHGIDDCKCGRKGRYFTISGRIPQTEIRGCSDTHSGES